MNTKLTLRLDDELIRKAKAHARQVGKPASKLVEDYFAVLTTSPRQRASDLTPRVRRLKGILRDAEVDEEIYRRHLKDKYLAATLPVYSPTDLLKTLDAAEL